MDYILYVQEYYYYLILFIGVLIVASLLSYSTPDYKGNMVNVIVFFFAAFSAYYIGSRKINIGVDTINYLRGFKIYENAKSFEIENDPFFISYIFAKILDFRSFLFFCAFLYVFGAWYGLKKIFKKNYFIPFLFFLISPYFIAWGVNVMRSGMAASLFLLALGAYYNKKKKWKIIGWLLVSVLTHISMFVPILFFFLTGYLKSTKFIFFAWLSSIALSVLKINIIGSIVNILNVSFAQIAFYAINEGERVFWSNFLIFGFFPVVFAVYNILVLKYKNDFYKWLVNAYMLTHIPYIILLNSQYGLRLGYLAEFMMPIILLFPLLINPELKIKYSRLKLSILLFCVFMLKAYKILVM